LHTHAHRPYRRANSSSRHRLANPDLHARMAEVKGVGTGAGRAVTSAGLSSTPRARTRSRRPPNRRKDGV
jgi:hypothetical protein